MSHPASCPICPSPTDTHVFAEVASRTYWRCDACEATFLDPQQLPSRTDELTRYQQHRNEADDPGYRRFLSRLATPLLERLAPNQSGLDYGCGPEPVLAGMLREAGHRMALYDPLFRDDVAVLEHAYDFVTCTEVVEHFHHPAEEFARLDGLLKPGGWLAVMTNFLTDEVSFANWHYRRDFTHVVFYREKTFRVIAERHGWRCEIPAANVALLRKALR